MAKSIAMSRKFLETADMLELSFAEIMKRLNDEKLQDFSVKELSGLVCALFSDTPLRRKNLAEIKSSSKLRKP